MRILWHSICMSWNPVDLHRKYTRRTQDGRKRLTLCPRPTLRPHFPTLPMKIILKILLWQSYFDVSMASVDRDQEKLKHKRNSGQTAYFQKFWEFPPPGYWGCWRIMLSTLSLNWVALEKFEVIWAPKLQFLGNLEGFNFGTLSYTFKQITITTNMFIDNPLLRLEF